MKDYSIDNLYDEGYINGEVYYLCDENGISSLADAVKLFSEPNPPKYVESLRRVCLELLDEYGQASFGGSLGWRDENNESSIPEEERISFQNETLFRKLFDESLRNCSVRAYHAITAVKEEYNSYTEFFNWVLSSGFNPMRLKNVGRKTYKELQEWKAYIQHYLFTHQRFFSKEQTELPEENEIKTEDYSDKESTLFQNESFLKELFHDSLKGYSVRAVNALKKVKVEYASFAVFFKWVLSNEFDPIQLKNVGRKTVVELKDWKASIQNAFLKHLSDKTDHPIVTEDVKSMNSISIWDKNALFDGLFGFIDSLKDSRRALVYYLAENNIGNGLSAIAKAINLSRERVRQLIPRVLSELGKYLKSKTKSFNYSKEEYLHLAGQCSHSLNKEFVIWVGAQVSSEIVLIGSFKEFICRRGLFLMVDAQLASVFDFNLFIEKVDSLADKKFFEDTRVKIEDIVLDCFPSGVRFELLPAITRTCRTILYEHYPYHLSEDEILIPANAYYSVRQRVEDILAKEGTALTIDRIRARLVESGVDYNGTDNQLVSLIRNSSMIISYGNPCKFALTIWGKPEEDAYGTIRDVAIHILLKHDPPIMDESSLVSALLSFFPESSWRSIISNLMSDSRQRFGVYQKGNEKYIGLTKENYDSSFVLQVKSEAKRPSSLSQDKLSWQGTFDSVKRVLCTHDWTALDDKQRKWLVANWKKAQSGTLKDWQATQILDLIETSKKK